MGCLGAVRANLTAPRSELRAAGFTPFAPCRVV
jgi:hypothetical protein